MAGLDTRTTRGVNFLNQEPLKRIGSFFESPTNEMVGEVCSLPWEDGTNISYVQTGRQALSFIGQVYASEGRDKLIVPDYLCQSMISGFDSRKWELSTYRVAGDLTIDTDNLLEKVVDPESTVVLSATYFGNEPTNRHVFAIRELQREGVRVIEDETHRIFGSLERLGDVGIASLRKLIPIADGAYIRGNLICEPSAQGSSAGWVAMDEKTAGNLTAANAFYAKAHEELASNVQTQFAPSMRSMELIKTLDYESMKEQRRRNAGVLRGLLADLSGINVVVNAEVPSHLVVQVENAKSVQKTLAERNIFCPIHWPQPEQFRGRPWRNNLLSIPIDQRYDYEDMLRIAAEMKRL